ncbi:helix-turn-helix domain-containing protein [Escherichia coli]|uniref:helix-turn-helix domain-containing protein n=1 Tax=Escherichia TaxID=561 RepID=UPI0015EA0D36|nr:helix-turn-helix domain-containing protein [Escherichia fergusonii]EGO4572874.1 helix-turn-helix domain-containing protein [Escherichia coli]QMB01962.1 winged helix-turn-helix domain-containing protein [Escherichia fergusonii]QMB10934.1 winged helix-turn-helix domain-containing protein [Escherichia fergusonii]QMC64831.1 winged helix-turn-helix domain-containing protein [Escherichia fergusonii]HBA4739150.1 helix-turn-helix domain-containing protein [Escherichia coli]
MEKFHMFDDRIYQMTNGVKAADRIIYTVMLNEQKFYHDKGQYYTPSYAHLGQYAGITRTSVIACMKRLEAHGLIKKTNVASNQCVIKVYSLDEVPEVLTELTAKEARKAKLESKVTQSVKKDDPLSQNSLPTESKFFTQSVKIFDTYNNSNNKKKLINNNKEDGFEEESLKKGASLCDSHECDSLGIEEAIKKAVKTSDLDDLDSEATKEAIKKEDKISDVNIDSDHKNTQCPATDDEMDPFDDDEEDEESEREKAIKRVEKKKRFELARQKNKVSGLDPFDDSDDDDFSFTPRKKQTQGDKKQKIKPKMYFAGGGMR